MNPFNGTWIANLSRSQRHPNHQFQSAKLHFEVSADNVSLIHEGVNMSGRYESGRTIFYVDGKEHASPEALGVNVVSQWIGTHLIDTRAFRNGELVGHGTYEVSPDGTTLTATVFGTDASGKEFRHAIVFDRE